MNLNKLIWKTDVIWQFLNKNTQLKKYKFLCKKISLISLDLDIICNLTNLQDKKTKVKFMLRILEKIYVRWETGSGSGSKTN
jgi:hypothetical protein